MLATRVKNADRFSVMNGLLWNYSVYISSRTVLKLVLSGFQPAHKQVLVSVEQFGTVLCLFTLV